VSGKWSIRFNDNKDKSMDLNLWVSGGTVMGYGTLTEAGAKNSVTAVGSVNPRELTLIAKSAAPNQANKEGGEYDLDLFVVNCAHSGTYVLKSGKLPLHNGNVTAVKQ
jgi:hypothetical protein